MLTEFIILFGTSHQQRTDLPQLCTTRMCYYICTNLYTYKTKCVNTSGMLILTASVLFSQSRLPSERVSRMRDILSATSRPENICYRTNHKINEYNATFFYTVAYVNEMHMQWPWPTITELTSSNAFIKVSLSTAPASLPLAAAGWVLDVEGPALLVCRLAATALGAWGLAKSTSSTPEHTVYTWSNDISILSVCVRFRQNSDLVTLHTVVVFSYCTIVSHFVHLCQQSCQSAHHNTPSQYSDLFPEQN